MHSEQRSLPGAGPLIRVLAYGPDDFTEGLIDNPQLVAQFPHAWPVTWISVSGLQDEQALAYLGSFFDLPSLVLRDITQKNRSAKLERSQGHYFILLKPAVYDKQLHIHTLSIFVGKNYLLTFHETGADLLDSVRDKVRTKKGNLRTSGVDALSVQIFEAVFESLFVVLDHYGEELQAMEDEAFQYGADDIVPRVITIKRELLSLRRAAWPLRDIFRSLARDETTAFQPETRLQLQDFPDQANQIMEFLESYRDLAGGVFDIHMSSSNTRLNEIMKVLTIISTIFIPLSFIASVYGMNFDTQVSPWNMPELEWYLGYPFCLGLMLIVALTLLLYFRHRRWLGTRQREDDSRESSVGEGLRRQRS